MVEVATGVAVGMWRVHMVRNFHYPSTMIHDLPRPGILLAIDSDKVEILEWYLLFNFYTKTFREHQPIPLVILILALHTIHTAIH